MKTITLLDGTTIRDITNAKDTPYRLECYRRSAGNTSIHKLYRHCSWAKQEAEQLCIEKMENNGGHGYRVLSHSKQFFTVGYVVNYVEDCEVCPALLIDTGMNKYGIRLGKEGE